MEFDVMEFDVFDNGKLLIHRHTTHIKKNNYMSSCVFKTLRIVHAVKGSADWLIGSKIYHIEKDDIVILNNIEVRQFFMNNNDSITINIYEFHPSSYNYNSECQNMFYNRGTNFNNVIRDNYLLDLLYKIDNEIINKNPLRNAMISGLLITFLIAATRVMNETNPDSVLLTENNQSSEYAFLIANAANYINNNLTSDLNLKSLAKISNISDAYFSRLFKKYIGVGVVDYINICRLNNVNKLLATTDCTINEAAFNSGYKTSSNYYRALNKYKIRL